MRDIHVINTTGILSVTSQQQMELGQQLTKQNRTHCEQKEKNL